jgi:predicted metal-binding membrane protein
VFLPIFGGLILFAWFALWAWSASPYAFYLQHGNWLDPGPLAILCRVIPGGDVVVPGALHTLGWVLMTVAMMLPTTLPLVEQFRRVTARRADSTVLVQLVIGGYLAVWTLFGVLAHTLDRLLLDVAAQSSWLMAHGWALGAGVIAGAGLFQFSALKYRCLDKCRTPFSYITSHWSGKRPKRDAMRLGLDHGAFCVGCCWALMLLMFVVGTGSIAWMMVLGAVMAMEKNMPWGRRISTPLGVVLLAIASGVVATKVF